jgi:hypothetical protein
MVRADVKAAVEASGKKWKDSSWSAFIVEVVSFLLGKGRDLDDTVAAAVGLIVYGVTTEEELQAVAGQPPDDEKFTRKLAEEGMPKAICDLLFAEYVAGTRGKKRPLDVTAATYDDFVSGKAWTPMGLLSTSLPALGELFNVTLISGACLGSTSEETHYCREATLALWSFMDDVRKKSGGRYGYLHGLPGTGKSTGVWHWLLSKAVHEHERVVWMHFEEDQFHVVVFHERKYTSFEVRSERAGDFVETLPCCYLVVDGLTMSQPTGPSVRGAVVAWVHGLDRFAVMTTSGKFKLKTEEQMIKGYHVFNMFSWTLQEFQDAFSAQDQALWKAKKSLFDGCDDPNDVDAAVTWKHQYAGGSARWMFAYSQTKVVDDIAKHIGALGSAMMLLNGDMGATSIGSKTHLLASYEENMYTIVSRYATDKLVQRSGTGFVQHMKQVAWSERNPTLRGWAFELGFFVEIEQAAREGREIRVKVRGTSDRMESWPGTIVNSFDPEAFDATELIGSWARPTKWNQGGYDAVLMTAKGDNLTVDIKVVQVTSAASHALKLRYVESLIARTVEAGLEVINVDIVFVIPRGAAFLVGPVTGVGPRLEALHWGERTMDDMVRVVELIGTIL